MIIRADSSKIVPNDGNFSIRLGVYFDDKLISVRISHEYLVDKFRRSTATNDELIDLVKSDIHSIEEIIRKKIEQGVAPADVVVSSTDI